MLKLLEPGFDLAVIALCVLDPREADVRIAIPLMMF
jgi:hypothetical protein